jgi:cation/acetate symporter
LAVVSGLTLAGASAISHDIYANVINSSNKNEKKELFVSRIATIFLGILAIFLGIIFEKQNIAFMVGLAFAIAASTNFPIIFLSMFWKNLTTRGAFFGGLIGLLVTIALVILSPVVWVDVFNFSEAIFPYKYPALFSMTTTFFFVIFISLSDRSSQAIKDKKGFQEQFYRSITGIGIEKGKKH